MRETSSAPRSLGGGDRALHPSAEYELIEFASAENGRVLLTTMSSSIDISYYWMLLLSLCGSALEEELCFFEVSNSWGDTAKRRTRTLFELIEFPFRSRLDRRTGAVDLMNRAIIYWQSHTCG